MLCSRLVWHGFGEIYVRSGPSNCASGRSPSCRFPRRVRCDVNQPAQMRSQDPNKNDTREMEPRDLCHEWCFCVNTTWQSRAKLLGDLARI